MVGPHLLLGGSIGGEPIAWHLALLLTSKSSGAPLVCMGLATRIHLGRWTQGFSQESCRSRS